MKILIHTKLYEDMKRSFYLDEQVDRDSYRVHLEKMINYTLSWFPNLYFEAKSHNHDAELVFGNDELLQKKWAADNDGPYKGEWSVEIAFEQVKAFRPDIYFFSGSTAYYKTFFPRIRPYVGKIVCWLSAAFPDNWDLSSVDLLISDNDKILDYGKGKGIKNEKMISSVPAECVNFSENYLKRKNGLTFTGSLGHQFIERKRLLKYLTDNGLDINIYCGDVSEDSPLTMPIGRLLRRILPSEPYRQLSSKKIIPIYNLLKKYMNPPVFGRNMIQLLGNSKMVLNMHADFDIDYAINMRVFESLISGALLFTEKNSAVTQCFQDSKELIIYDDTEDLVQKVEYFTSNPEEAESIAREGQKKIENNHLVSHWFDKFISLVS